MPRPTVDVVICTFDRSETVVASLERSRPDLSGFGRVLEMAASPALTQSLGRRAMQKVRERHDVAVAGPKILEIMRGMM